MEQASAASRELQEKGRRPILTVARWITGNRPHLLVVGATLVIFAGSFLLSWLLRFEFMVPTVESSFMVLALPFVLGIKLIVLYLWGIYRILWAYIGIRDLLRFL